MFIVYNLENPTSAYWKKVLSLAFHLPVIFNHHKAVISVHLVFFPGALGMLMEKPPRQTFAGQSFGDEGYLAQLRDTCDDEYTSKYRQNK